MFRFLIEGDNVEEFKLSKLTQKASKLLEDVQQEYQKLNLDDSALPKVLIDSDSVIKLVFVGQYSAGKSSIVKMLTGHEVEIDASITTQTAQPYSWNGLEIIDTPGIHNELRPDHDKLTYDQINHAALLIFVITNEGFSQRMGDHFRTLAIEQKRAANMVLVVNKMDRTALGNVPEQQNIIAGDLEKVTEPYKPQDLYLSFLDTTSYFDSLEETDSEIKAELLQLSGHDAFVSNLNEFVSSHKLLAKVTKPLYTVADVIRKNINLNLANDDKDIAEFLQTIDYRKNLLNEGKRQCLRDIRDIATACRNEILQQGREAANVIQPTNEKTMIDNTITDAQHKVEEIVNNYNSKIEDTIRKSLADIGEEIAVYNSTDFVKQINLKIDNRIKFERQSAGNGAIGGALAGIGALIGKFANPAAVAVGNPGAFAILAGKGVGAGANFLLAGELGIFAKAIAVPLENFVVKLLTPPPTVWQQIGALLARNAGAIGNIVAGVGAAFAIGMEVKAAKEAQELENLLQTEREKLINSFNDIADKIYNSMNDNATKWAKENIDSIINECDKNIQSLRSEKEQSKLIDVKLRQLLKQTEDLIDEIQSDDIKVNLQKESNSVYSSRGISPN